MNMIDMAAWILSNLDIVLLMLLQRRLMPFTLV